MSEITITNNETRLEVFSGRLSSDIRRGGTGNRAWIARLTEKRDDKFGFEREFCRKINNASGSMKSGHLAFVVTEPGVYEYRNFGGNAVNSRTEMSGFLQISEDGTVKEIEKEEAESLIP